MKKLLIFATLILFCISPVVLRAQIKVQSVDSQLFQINQQLFELQSKTHMMDSIVHNKQNSAGEEIELVMGNLKNATLLVEIMAFFLAFFLAWLSVLSFKEFKQGKKKFEKISHEASEKLDKSEVVCQNVLTLERRLTKDLAYTKIGLDSLFDILTDYFSLDGNKRMREIAFMKSNICKLYSLEDETRFAGITALIYGGDISCIEHLEKISLDPDETLENKQLAIHAILAINKRANFGNKAA